MLRYSVLARLHGPPLSHHQPEINSMIWGKEISYVDRQKEDIYLHMCVSTSLAYVATERRQTYFCIEKYVFYLSILETHITPSEEITPPPYSGIPSLERGFEPWSWVSMSSRWHSVLLPASGPTVHCS